MIALIKLPLNLLILLYRYSRRLNKNNNAWLRQAIKEFKHLKKKL